MNESESDDKTNEMLEWLQMEADDTRNKIMAREACKAAIDEIKRLRSLLETRAD